MMTSLNSINQLRQSNAPSAISNAATTNAAAMTTQQASTSASSFAQQLATANSAQSSPGASGVSNSLINTAKATSPAADASLAPDNFDLNSLNLSSNALSSSGLNSSEFLNQTLRSGIEAQFNLLGKEIAASFIAGLAGQGSAAEAPIEASPNSTGAIDTKAAAAPVSEAEAGNDPLALNTADNTESDPNLTDNTIPPETAQTASAETQSSTSIFPESLLNFFDSLQNLSFLKPQETSSNEDQESDNETTTQLDSSTLETTSGSQEAIVS